MFRKWDFRPRPWWAPFPLVYSSFKRRRQTTGGNGRRVARVEEGMSTSSIKKAVSDSSDVRPNHKPSLFYYALSRANVAHFAPLSPPTHRLVAEVVDDAAEEDLLADEDRDVAVRAARPVDARVHDVLLREARLRRRRRPRPPHAADAAARTLLRGRGRGRGRDAAAALVVAAPVILPARTWT